VIARVSRIATLVYHNCYKDVYKFKYLT